MNLHYPHQLIFLTRGAHREETMNRRQFIKQGGIAAGAALLSGAHGLAATERNRSLQVWSCGGLAEAFIPANAHFEKNTGTSIAYTGAFAGALGKSLLANAQTEIFAPRVLGLSKKLKAQGKMVFFEPLCFTEYVVATPRGNPANITGIEDMGKPGVKTILSPDASPPGGQATMIIMKKAGVAGMVEKNAVTIGDCVQTTTTDLVKGKGDAAVIEKRITMLPQFKDHLDVIPIPEKFIPPVPVPFTIGMMKWAKNETLAKAYIDFILSEEGQAFFEAAGFIPARSDEGRRLIQKYGVRDA